MPCVLLSDLIVTLEAALGAGRQERASGVKVAGARLSKLPLQFIMRTPARGTRIVGTVTKIRVSACVCVCVAPRPGRPGGEERQVLTASRSFENVYVESMWGGELRAHFTVETVSFLCFLRVRQTGAVQCHLRCHSITATARFHFLLVGT